MNRKELIVVIAVMLGAFGATAGVFAITKDSKPAKKTGSSETSEHSGHAHNHAEHAATGAISDPQEDLTNQTEVTIGIQEYSYLRPNIKIKKGTAVTWINEGNMEHNVMHAHHGDEEAHAAPAKDEVKSDVLAGPLLQEGESYSFVFTEVGTFPYHCAPHPFMTGSVTVVE